MFNKSLLLSRRFKSKSWVHYFESRRRLLEQHALMGSPSRHVSDDDAITGSEAPYYYHEPALAESSFGERCATQGPFSWAKTKEDGDCPCPVAG